MSKIIILNIVIFANFVYVKFCKAAFLENRLKLWETTNNVKTKAGFASAPGEGSLENLISTFIAAFLGLLGIIFIILMILSGYNWMTANGDDEKITKAKKTIQAALIGLIITIAAYSITYFIFRYLPGN